MKKILLRHILGFSLAAALAGQQAPVLAAPVDLTSWLALGDSRVTANSATVTTAFSDEALIGSGGGALDITVLES